MVIVVSILLAFAIDAWWDDRKDRIEEKKILIGLRAEFLQNRKFIEYRLRGCAQGH